MKVVFTFDAIHSLPGPHLIFLGKNEDDFDRFSLSLQEVMKGQIMSLKIEDLDFVEIDSGGRKIELSYEDDDYFEISESLVKVGLSETLLDKMFIYSIFLYREKYASSSYDLGIEHTNKTYLSIELEH